MERCAAALLDLVLPRRCPGCEAWLPLGHGHALCPMCQATLLMPVDTLCDRCGIPLLPGSYTCSPCMARPPAYDTARALGLYLAEQDFLNPLARAGRALKYHGHRAVARSLGAALADLLPIPEDAVVVPIPLHVTRLRARGYDQSVLLARALARTRRLQLIVRALVRHRATATQANLDAAARRANVRDAFTVTGAVDGATVVLVDDVLTTGATADSCARALRAAHAAHVLVLTVGRTP